ncbi:MAG: hypothetical protein GVY28_04530, partial [Alphaproteobacteria bacterium]|nr:hypothetical protein [Alphaproteobacteria bacterium]
MEFSSKTRDLAEDLSAVRLDRAAFSASGAPERAEAVSTGLADLSGRTVALRDTADGARAERLDAMVEQLGDYAVAFDALLAAHHGRIDNAAEMQARADELAGLAERIATDQAARYAQARDRMGALNGDLDASLEVSRLAESLDRLATAAGAGQADYLLTGAQEDADRTAEAIRDLFMTSMSLRRAVAGTEQEQAAAEIAEAAQAYRQAFQSLLEAVDAETVAENGAASAADAIGQVASRFLGLTADLRQAVAERETAAEADARPDGAAAAASGPSVAGRASALALDARAAESAILRYLWSNNFMAANEAGSRLQQVQTAAEELRAAVSVPDLAALAEAIVAEATAFRTEMDALTAAMVDRSTAVSARETATGALHAAATDIRRLAGEVAESRRTAYEAQRAEVEAARAAVDQAVGLRDQATRLIELSQTARLGVRDYQLGDTGAAETVTDAIGAIFATAVRMKPALAGTEGEGLTTEIAGAANAYRGGFEALLGILDEEAAARARMAEVAGAVADGTGALVAA